MSKGRASDVGRLVRTELQRFGGLWIKAGQVLASSVDVYPRAFREALVDLRDHAIQIPGDTVKAIIEDEIGQPLGRVFREFDVVPKAIHSFGQTHVAWLHDGGAKVAVKVQRPGAREALARDLKEITRAASFLRIAAFGQWSCLEDLRIELERTVHLTADYRNGARTMREIRRTTDKKCMYVPKVFSRYGKERVLVMEFIDGALMSDYHRARTSSPKRTRKWCKQNSIRPRKLQRRLDETTQIALGDDMFLLRNDRIAIVDAHVLCVVAEKCRAKRRDDRRRPRTSSSP